MSWLDRLADKARQGARSGLPDLRRTRPPRVAVVTDSAAALPPEWVAENADILRVVPMPVMVNGQIYGEGVDDLSQVLYMALAQGQPVKTSRPSPGLLESVYRSLETAGFDAAVSVHISGGLSGTVDAARLAAGRVRIPISVVDSRTVAMAQGFGVMAAVEAARGGADAVTAAAAVSTAGEDSAIYFSVPSLEQLRRGGRIGAAASLIGTLLAVKPILTVSGGIIAPVEKVRTTARAVARLEELTDAELSVRKEPRLAVHHFGVAEQAGSVAARLAERYPGITAVVNELPAVLAAHTGLGVLATVVTGRRRDGVPDAAGPAEAHKG